MNTTEKSGGPDRPLSRWLERQVSRVEHNPWSLALLSAGEATVLPIPMEPILVPLMLARPRAAIAIALWALAGCLAGTLALYLAGWLLADQVVLPLLDRFGLLENFQAVEAQLQGGDLFRTVVFLSVSPLPVQMASIGAGILGASLPVLLAAIVVARGGRYLGLALLAITLGPRLRRLPARVWWGLGAALATALLLWQVL